MCGGGACSTCSILSICTCDCDDLSRWTRNRNSFTFRFDFEPSSSSSSTPPTNRVFVTTSSSSSTVVCRTLCPATTARGVIISSISRVHQRSVFVIMNTSEDNSIEDHGVLFELRRCSTPVSEYPIPTEEVERESRTISMKCFCRMCTLEQIRYKAFLQQLHVPTEFGAPPPCWTMKHYGTHIPVRRPLNLAQMAMLIGGDFHMTTRNLNYQKTFII